MTNMNPTLPFPDPSDPSLKSRAKRKWGRPTLTIEAVGNTAGPKPIPSVLEGGITFGPAS
jgi:hypothetical protein